MDSDRSHKLILCVEDHQAMADLIRDRLAQFDFEFATNYDDAVRLLESHHFSLILIDQCLEGERTGLELCTYIRDRGIDTPTFLMSTEDFISHEIVRNAGGRALIRKDQHFLSVLTSIANGVLSEKITQPQSP
jgi:CheY-like chemotaxis protein